jgi:hypothetical protein
MHVIMQDGRVSEFHASGEEYRELEKAAALAGVSVEQWLVERVA